MKNEGFTSQNMGYTPKNEGFGFPWHGEKSIDLKHFVAFCLEWMILPSRKDSRSYQGAKIVWLTWTFLMFAWF